MTEMAQVAVTKREEQKLRKAERVLEDEPLRNLRDVMELPAGRRFLWEMLERTRVYQTTLAVDEDNRLDALQVCANEGERQLGLWLIDQLTEASPRLWLQMQAERLEDNIAKEAAAIDATAEQGDEDE